MALVDLTQGLQRPVRPIRRRVLRIENTHKIDIEFNTNNVMHLVRMQSIDVEAGDVHARRAVDDPVGHQATHASAGQDADGVHAGRHKVVLQLRRLANYWTQVRGERLLI